MLDISSMRSEIGEGCCLALPAIHCFTGNDYTSAFHGIGKKKSFQLLKNNEEYQRTFQLLGDSFTFDASLFPILEKFVCQLYGLKSHNTDEARFEKFCAKDRAPEPERLPPTRDALLYHCKRVSYVTAIIKRSLDATASIPNATGYGWILQDGILEIEWMIRPPAPEGVLQLISCNCKKSKCKTRICICKSHSLNCTDLCHCVDCDNIDVNYEESSASSDERSDSF